MLHKTFTPQVITLSFSFKNKSLNKTIILSENTVDMHTYSDTLKDNITHTMHPSQPLNTDAYTLRVENFGLTTIRSDNGSLGNDPMHFEISSLFCIFAFEILVGPKKNTLHLPKLPDLSNQLQIAALLHLNHGYMQVHYHTHSQGNAALPYIFFEHFFTA